jgi:uncharacterized membrane protein
MATTHIHPFGKAFGLGIIAGMRSMSAPALTSHFLTKVPAIRLAGTPWRYMQSKPVSTGMKVLAFTEMVADKLPSTPDRIAPPVLGARIISGALVGATLSQADGQPKWAGALLGSIGAVMGSYGFYFLRKKLGQTTSIPDFAWALAEDALVLAGGISLAQMPPART